MGLLDGLNLKSLLGGLKLIVFTPICLLAE